MSAPVRYSGVAAATCHHVTAAAAAGVAAVASAAAAAAAAVAPETINLGAAAAAAAAVAVAGSSASNGCGHAAVAGTSRSGAGGAAADGSTAAAEQWHDEGRFGTPDAAAGTSRSAINNNNHHNAMNMDMHNPHEYHHHQQMLLQQQQQQQQQQQHHADDVEIDDDEDDDDDYRDDDRDHVEQHMLRKAMAAAAAAAEMRPTPPTEQLFAQLHEALALESKYQPSLFLPKDSNSGDITCGTRDGAAQVLRCLKMWYELPSDVLFTAINLVDRFLTKMKVKPKHIACISVGSFLLAVNQLGLPKMDTDDLVTISQCRCTSGDLERMAGIIANKLGVQMGTQPVTSLACLRLFYYIFRNAAHEMGCGEFYDSALQLPELEMQLEILTCDAECANQRATELALVLVCTQLDAGIAKSMEGQSGHYQCLVDYAIEMQNLCRVSEGALFESFGTVVKILSRYNGQHKMPYRQRLVWKLSSRTMRVLRPTDKLTSHLPTIAEHNVANNNTAAAAFACRFRTGSVSSEEGEDWPSSPVVPVYEQC